ncbi:MAG: SCE4755 family polysaccharide monooxygenase-like protein [Nannocystales bacterium]
MRRLAILTTLTGLAIGSTAITTDDAQAHFRLEAPAVMTVQNDLGDPQKDYPCGTVDGALTGDITAYTAGDTVSITISEQIYHPGHYRVALATNDVSELPADPPITPTPQDQCASTEIMDPPVFPVIADGMLAHSGPFDGEQSFEVTLPEDVTCDNCTLQVVQYMSSHSAPCFYYHCANISIAPAGAGDTTGGPSGGSSGDPTGEPATSTGTPDPTGEPGGSTSSGASAGSNGTDQPPGTSTDAPTETDGIGQGEPGGGSGCAVGGSGTAAWLVLIPLFAFSRRRDRRGQAS